MVGLYNLMKISEEYDAMNMLETDIISEINSNAAPKSGLKGLIRMIVNPEKFIDYLVSESILNERINIFPNKTNYGPNEDLYHK